MVSIVVPVFNECEALSYLYARLCGVMQSLGESYELVFVDDGSTDQSGDLLLKLSREDKNVKVLELSRNFGHQVAIMAGLDYAEGDAVITMDADLQHPPELIPELIKKWREGYEVVYTCRSSTADTGLVKSFTSRLFYRIANALSEVPIPPGAADFRLLDRTVVQVFRKLGERALFVRGLVSWVGFRQAMIPYQAGGRHGGKTKYSMPRMLGLAADGIVSFSTVPLYISALIGVVISSLSFIYVVYALYIRLFTDRGGAGWASILTSILLIGGIQLITLGVLGIYLGKIYNEVKGRPRYLIRRLHGYERGS